MTLPPAHSAGRSPLRAAAALMVTLGVLAIRDVASAGPWIVFTEVHYRPAGEDAGRLEFVEIYNTAAPSVRLAGWRLDGEVTYRFPDVELARGNALVIARDPDALRERHPGLARVVGPFEGRLDDDGGRVALLDALGVTRAEMRYGHSSAWPAEADGTGHTLEIVHPFLDATSARDWRASRERGGSPGRVDAHSALGEVEVLVARDAAWRYLRGRAEPPSDWTSLGFDDAGWELGPGGFGFGDGDDATVIEDMRGRYLALFTRATFHREAADRRGRVVLRVDFDDGFVAYLNGREVARENMGAPGEPATAVTPAATFNEVGRPREFDLGPAARALVPGRNALAVQVHNHELDSSDLSLIVDLEFHAARRPADDRPPRPGPADAVTSGPRDPAAPPAIVINELMYHPRDDLAAEEYVELYNASDAAVSLEGFSLAGGIEFAFGAADVVPAGGFLVVAADPERLGERYPSLAGVVGPFRGRLSNRGESIALRDRSGAVVDGVRYADGWPWTSDADGFGPSLELVHPALDNSLAGAWAASDEAARGEWTSIAYTKELGPSRVGAPTHVQLMLLEAGECAIDEFRLSDSSGRAIVAHSFDATPSGDAPRWRGSGTHDGSAVTIDAGGRGHLRLAASGRGSSRQNFVALALEEPLAAGETYTVAFRARWLAGSPLLLSRVSGQGLAAMHRLPVPAGCGTPGRRNSRWSARPAAVVGDLEQRPVAPSSSERVRVSVRVTSLANVVEVAARFRHESDAVWRESPLLRSEPDGRWSGFVPALPPGRVELYVAARDERGLATFPPDAPARTALYGIDLVQHPEFPTYTVLVSDRAWREADKWELLSNRLVPASVVFGNARIVHGAGLRLRGSPWARGRENWKLEFGSDTLDGRSAMLFDGQEYRPTNLSERMTFWVLEQLGVAGPRMRYVHLSVPGRERWSGLCEDVERIDGAYLERWFGARADEAEARERGRGGVAPRALLHKIDGHWEVPSWPRAEVDAPEFQRVRQTFLGATLDMPTDDLEDVRWNYPPRLDTAEVGLEPLGELLRVLDTRRTPTERFESEIERMANVEQWLRVLAARVAVNDWDSVGGRRGKNGFLYRRTVDGLWYLLPWDGDKSWSTQRFGLESVFPDRLPALARLVEVPRYRRSYMSALAFIAERLLEPRRLEGVLDEFRFTGESAADYLRFARMSRDVIARQLPDVPFAVGSVVTSSDGEGRFHVRASGTAPLLVHELRLDGERGETRFLDERRWEAAFRVGAVRDAAVLTAHDLAGGLVQRAEMALGASP